MKKRLFALVVVLISCFQVSRADEGMWLLYLLGDKVYQDMVKKGLKLSKEQLYSLNKASIKDAIIISGGGFGRNLNRKRNIIQELSLK